MLHAMADGARTASTAGHRYPEVTLTSRLKAPKLGTTEFFNILFLETSCYSPNTFESISVTTSSEINAMRLPWVFEGFGVGSCRMILILAPITHNEVFRSDLQWVEG